jgi:hypothetical protein
MELSPPRYNGSPWVPLKPWLPIIAKSQGFEESDVPTILLPRSYCTVLLSAQNEDDYEDLKDLFPKKTAAGREMISLFGSGERLVSYTPGDQSLTDYPRYFLRLDDNSVKDARVEGGSGALTDVAQIWRRLAASERGKEGIRERMKRGHNIEVFLLPWRDDFDIKREYRVFCPPRADKEMRVNAISQYKWYEACYDGFTKEMAKQILHGAQEIHRQILTRIGEGDDLRKYGFVFDVFHTVGGEVQLIELNPFGAMSGCGSCLFSWAADARVLYGLEDEIEFRVCR